MIQKRNRNRKPKRRSNGEANQWRYSPLVANLYLEIDMKLTTPELEELFQDYPLYSQEDADDTLIVARLFDPCSAATWYLLEYDPVEKIAFGYVTGLCENEFGYTSLIELESIERPFGLTIERDLYFVQKRLSEVKN